MPRATIDFSQHTDREILMNVVPRLENVEMQVEQQGRRQDALEQSINALRRDLMDTEARLSRKVDERFDKIDAHLVEQDKRLDRLADGKRKWPDGAIIVVTAVCTALVGIGVEVLRNLFKF